MSFFYRNFAVYFLDYKLNTFGFLSIHVEHYFGVHGLYFRECTCNTWSY